MSEQVGQRQVPLIEGKTLVNFKGVYGSKFGNEMHFLSFAMFLLSLNAMFLFLNDERKKMCSHPLTDI